jgi:hypothetical protein
MVKAGNTTNWGWCHSIKMKFLPAAAVIVAVAIAVVLLAAIVVVMVVVVVVVVMNLWAHQLLRLFVPTYHFMFLSLKGLFQ